MLLQPEPDEALHGGRLMVAEAVKRTVEVRHS